MTNCQHYCHFSTNARTTFPTKKRHPTRKEKFIEDPEVIARMRKEKENSLGGFYQHTVFKARQKSMINWQDTNYIIDNVKHASHLKYAMNIMKERQRTGQDYSEELCDKFVRKYLEYRKFGKAMEVAEYLADYETRLSAWMHPDTCELLVEAVSVNVNVSDEDNETSTDTDADTNTEDEEEISKKAKVLLDLVTNAQKKGMSPTKKTFDLLLQYFIKANNSPYYRKAVVYMALPEGGLAVEDVDELKKKYPFPVQQQDEGEEADAEEDKETEETK